MDGDLRFDDARMQRRCVIRTEFPVLLQQMMSGERCFTKVAHCASATFGDGLECPWSQASPLVSGGRPPRLALFVADEGEVSLIRLAAPSLRLPDLGRLRLLGHAAEHLDLFFGSQLGGRSVWSLGVGEGEEIIVGQVGACLIGSCGEET